MRGRGEIRNFVPRQERTSTIGVQGTRLGGVDASMGIEGCKSRPVEISLSAGAYGQIDIELNSQWNRNLEILWSCLQMVVKSLSRRSELATRTRVCARRGCHRGMGSKQGERIREGRASLTYLIRVEYRLEERSADVVPEEGRKRTKILDFRRAREEGDRGEDERNLEGTGDLPGIPQ